MKDINGNDLELYDIIYIHNKRTRYIILEIDEEQGNIIYRECGKFQIWCSKYEMYKDKIEKAVIFCDKKLIGRN